MTAASSRVLPDPSGNPVEDGILFGFQARERTLRDECARLIDSLRTQHADQFDQLDASQAHLEQLNLRSGNPDPILSGLIQSEITDVRRMIAELERFLAPINARISTELQTLQEQLSLLGRAFEAKLEEERGKLMLPTPPAPAARGKATHPSGVFLDRVPWEVARSQPVPGELDVLPSLRARRSPRWGLILPALGVVLSIVVVIVAMASRGGLGLPVGTNMVQTAADKACQNPDVVSEPNGVNVACNPTTRKILLVFALAASGNNPNFADSKTGRQGLEPITPSQGGQVAASLNLHHPYDPANQVDSLSVAARSLNNIAGGATVVDAKGNSVVQDGLESHAAKCLRYTGSRALNDSTKNWPAVCSHAITPQGQAALVGDIFREWIVGVSSETVRAVVTLYVNWSNPGSQAFQDALHSLTIQG